MLLSRPKRVLLTDHYNHHNMVKVTNRSFNNKITTYTLVLLDIICFMLTIMSLGMDCY